MWIIQFILDELNNERKSKHSCVIPLDNDNVIISTMLKYLQHYDDTVINFEQIYNEKNNMGVYSLLQHINNN